MQKQTAKFYILLGTALCLLLVTAFEYPHKITDKAGSFKFTLTPTKRFVFNSFVDCNMSEVWVGDTFRIFPGKYGEDPLWGPSNNLKYADGRHIR